MNKESFYLTLLSNSSIEYFPDKKTTNLSTKLPKAMKLEGEWSVGVGEFQYPSTMFTVQDHENVIYITKSMLMPNEDKSSTVYYKNIFQLSTTNRKFGNCSANLHLGLPSQLFLCYDIIDPQIVGDVMTPLLVNSLDPTKYIYGANKMHIFSPTHYLPVMRREFDTLDRAQDKKYHSSLEPCVLN